MQDAYADILIVGGGLGGVAAALAACREGRSVILTEGTDWLGGQLTSQAVPPDEHPWIEMFGCTASYRELRDGIRDYYRRHYPLTATARQRSDLNPGAGFVSRLCHEPRVALAVIEALLAPHRASGRLSVLLGHRPVFAQVDGDRIASVTTVDPAGVATTLVGRYFLDATECGDLLGLTGTEHVLGAESHDDFGEPHAPSAADPGNMQGFSVCFAMSHHPGQDHTIARPEQYDKWRSHRPRRWPGPLLGMSAPDPRTLEPAQRWLDPNPDDDPVAISADQSKDQGDKDLWRFRRIVARGLHQNGAVESDVTLVNWPMNDYWEGPLVGVDEATALGHLESARQLSLSLLFWLQTAAPRPDGGTGFPGLRLRPDITGTADGLAKAPYVRESRRIRARRTVTENDVAVAVLKHDRGPSYEDSVGIGSYRIDLHPSTGGDGYLDIPSVPFEIPLGSLIPIRVRNLLPACKNSGTTHIANGCFRLHPVEWNVGEVAGRLAAFCISGGHSPEAVHEVPGLCQDFGVHLDRRGVQRHWPDVSGY